MKNRVLKKKKQLYCVEAYSPCNDDCGGCLGAEGSKTYSSKRAGYKAENQKPYC